jgi:predicted DNA-binding helix-hairpin-helix protein
VNIELPTHDSVTRLAPEKNVHTIKLAMGSIRRKLDEKARSRRRRPSPRPARARR